MLVPRNVFCVNTHEDSFQAYIDFSTDLAAGFKKTILHGMIYTFSLYFLWTIVGKIGSRVEKILCPSLFTRWMFFVLPSLLFV